MMKDKMKASKCKRNVLADSNIVEAFWKIVQPEQSVRLENVEIIVNTLTQKKVTYKDGEIFPDLEYTLKRLIGGLASSRKAARQGFAVTLSEILRCFADVIHPNHAISLFFKLIPLSNATGERHASVIGQILAMQALVCSRKLSESPTCLPIVLETVLQLSNKKSYVEHAACLVLQELLTQVSQELFLTHLWPILDTKLRSGRDDCSPQDFWLLLICSRLFPDQVDADFLQTHWNTRGLYSSEMLPFVAQLLKKSTVVHPRVHPLCSEIIQQVTGQKKIFKEFWNLVINETLLCLNQLEEAYLVFQLVKLVLPKLKTAKHVKYVLSAKLRNLFIRSVKTRHSPLYSASSELCDFLVDYAGKVEDPEIQFSILRAFISPPGTLLFDQIARKNSVQSLTNKLKFEAIKDYADVLANTLLGENLEENDKNLTESLKCHAARQLCRLSGHPMVEGVCKSGILQQLFLHGFFSIQQESQDIPWCGCRLQLSEPVKESCRQSFLRGLELQQNPPIKKGFWGRFHHQRDTLSPLLDFAHLLLESPNVVQPVRDFNTLRDSWQDMYSMVKKVRRWSAKEEKDDQQSCIFQIFYLQIAFQLFYDLENTDRILKELNECCKRSLKSWRHSKRASERETDPDEPHWADVIMDLMLSMLSDKSPFLRGIVNSVFPAVCPYFTVDSLRLLVEAINPMSEDDPLSVDNEEEEIEFESGSSSDSDDDQVDEEMDPFDEKFRHDVKSALGDAAENGEEEDDLSDTEMFKLDDALSDAFRLRMKPSKKDKLKDEEAQMIFRLRCLELVEKYAKGEVRLCLIVSLVEPLVTAAKKGLTHHKLEGLATKACNILRIIASTKKFKDKSDVQMENLKILLKSLLLTAQKVSDSKFKTILSQLCSFIISCSRNLEQTAGNYLKQRSNLSEWYLELCKEHLKNYFEKGTSDLSPQLFDHLFLACEEHVWVLFDSLQAVAFQATTRLFKRTQAFVLLESMINKISKQSKSIEDSSRIKELYASLIPNAIVGLKEMAELGVKPTYTSKLLLLVHLILRTCRPDPTENCPVKRQLLEAVQAVPLKKLDKTGKKASHKIQAMLQSAGPKTSKKPKKRKSVPSTSEKFGTKLSKDTN